MKALELDPHSLMERITNVLGDCLAVGSLNRRTGALGAYLPRSTPWKEQLARAAVGANAVFPGVRLGAIAALLSEISAGRRNTAQFENVSITAEEGSTVVFQRCPWDEHEVLFVVLPDDGGGATNLAVLRVVLESVRRDVAIVRAPRVEERCWN
ncbi:MAG TPA: hypothetical protein VER04_07590 [Polyangiaceae bacterium]|nr:hypothetical protein [Polyangiaceae bacterium]